MYENAENWTFSSPETIHFFCEALDFQITYLAESTKSAKPGNRSSILAALLVTSARTATKIADLCREEYYGESVMLARSVVERCINFGYLMYCEESEYNRWIDHGFQKMYRRMSLDISTAGLRIVTDGTRNFSLEDNPWMQKLLNQFTSKKGNQITRWTTTSILERIDLLSKHCDVSPLHFMMSYGLIYEDASEALHGTFYGCAFEMGDFTRHFRQVSPEEVIKYRRENISYLLYGLHNLLFATLQVLSRAHGIDHPYELAKKRHDLVNEIFGALLKKKEKPS